MKTQTNKSNFAVFILTNGRPDRIRTLSTLKRSGYTGRVILLIDDEDETADEYRKLHGSMVQVFDKVKMAKEHDEGDNFRDRRSIIYARNAVFNVAKKLGIDYFIQLDDDYTSFQFRFDSKLNYGYKAIGNLDSVFKSLVAFLEVSGAKTLCMAQGGDFIGGGEGSTAQSIRLMRKAMNTFICKTNNPVGFTGRLNEDVNTYCSKGSRGDLFLTTNQVCVTQLQTQSNPGGITEMYKEVGTYVKSFYTVMFCPSSVVVAMMHTNKKRLHHKINWNKTVPKILRDDLKK